MSGSGFRVVRGTEVRRVRCNTPGPLSSASDFADNLLKLFPDTILDDWRLRDKQGYQCSFSSVDEIAEIIREYMHHDIIECTYVGSPATAGADATAETDTATGAETETGASNDETAEAVSEYADVVHVGVECDTCGMCPIVGPRFKCAVCPDFDLCTACDASDNHGEHPVVKMRKPQSLTIDAALGFGAAMSASASASACPGLRRAAAAAAAAATTAGVTREFAHACAISVPAENSTTVQNEVQDCFQPEPAAAGPAANEPAPLEDSWSALKDDLSARLALSASVLDTESSASAATASTAAAPAAATAATATTAAGRAFHAAFVDDVTVPDGERIAAGTVFTKTWLLRNEGEKAWPANTTLRLVGGEAMQASAVDAVVPRAAPGEIVQVSVDLVAPDSPGRYVSYYRVSNAGVFWGHRMWVEIMSIVAAPAAAGCGSLLSSSASESCADANAAADDDDDVSGPGASPALCSSEHGSHASEVLVDYLDAVDGTTSNGNSHDSESQSQQSAAGAATATTAPATATTAPAAPAATTTYRAPVPVSMTPPPSPASVAPTSTPATVAPTSSPATVAPTTPPLLAASAALPAPAVATSVTLGPVESNIAAALLDMGFTDLEKNAMAAAASGGELNAAIDLLMSS
jgi:hypothetical protein